MNYPFRMYGRIVQIYRYQAVYTEQQIQESGDGSLDFVNVEVTGYYPAEEEAKATGGIVTALDTTAYEWLDGIEVDDVPDTYAEAVKIYEMGEMAYKELIAQPTDTERIAALETAIADGLNLYEEDINNG